MGTVGLFWKNCLALRQVLALIIVATLLSACSIAVKIQSQLASMNPIAPQVVLSTAQTDFTNSTWTIDVTSSENITLTPADFLVVNGTVSNLTQIDDKHWSLVIQPAGEGPVEVSVPAKVAQGSTSALDNEASNTLSIVSDVTPPTATLSYLGTDPTNVSPLVINLVFDEPLAAAPTLSQIFVTNGTASNLTGSGQVYSYEITPSGQTATVSTQFLASQITDRAGNANTASNIVTVTFNSNKPFPTITSSASLAVNSPAITVDVMFSASVTGFTSSDITVTNALVSNFTGSGDTYSFTLTALSEGTFSANVVAGAAEDGAGNLSLPSGILSRVYDTTAPTLTLATAMTSPTNQAAATVTITASEAITGLDLSDFTVTNGTASTLSGSGTSYSVTITATAEGPVSVLIPAGKVADAASNTNTVSNTLNWYYDLAAPVMTISSMAASLTNVSPIPITFTVNESITGFAATNVSITNGTLSGFTNVDATHWTANVTPTADGTVSVTVPAASFQDLSGRTNGAASFSLTYDATRPTVTLSSLSAYTASSPVTVTATFSESVTGFTASDLVLTNATATVSGSGNVYTISVTPLTEAAFSVQVVDAAATDAAGNTSQVSNLVQSIYDITPPTATIISNVGPYAYETPVLFTVKFSEPVTGLVSSSFAIIGSAVTIGSITGSGSNYTVSLNVGGGFGIGSLSLTLKANAVTDASGKLNPAVSNTETVFYDATPVTISITSKEQMAPEAAGSSQNIGITMSGAKPYAVTLNYKLTGTALEGVDHTLPQIGQVVIPANQTSIQVPFELLANPSTTNKYFQFNLSFANTPVARFTANYQTRFMINDVDAGARSPASTIVSAYRHTCVKFANGKLKCWGENTYGELGDGTTTDRSSAVAVQSGATTFTKVVTGNQHTCAIVDNAQKDLMCWGRNDKKQLGFNDTTTRSTPTVLTSITGVDDVSAGDGYTCAIKSGKIYCWGDQTYGRLGNGLTAAATVGAPTMLTTGSAVDFDRITLGAATACAINVNNELYCWGYNQKNLVGDGLAVDVSTAKKISDGFLTVSLSSHFATFTPPQSGHACGLKTDFKIYCWGYNSTQQLGIDNDRAIRTSPTGITSTLEYSSVAAGQAHTCAIVKATGQVRCWGARDLGGTNTNYTGTLGLGYAPGTDIKATDIADTSAYVSLTAAVGHTCGITATGRVKCWGEFGAGYIGDQSNFYRQAPAITDAGDKYKYVSAGASFTCGITSDDILKCWGGSSFTTNIGDGSTLSRTSPVILDRGEKYSKVSSGYDSACGILTTGVLKCWGAYTGDGTASLRLTPVVADSGVTYSDVSVGSATTCGITTAGVLKCWGRDSAGVISGAAGTSTTYVNTPTIVDTGTSYKKISVQAGLSGHVCGITSTDDLKCWGYSDPKPLGRGPSAATYTPGVVTPGTKYLSVSVMSGRTCAITTANKLYCWGLGANYGTGLNSITNFDTPQAVDAAESYTSVIVNLNGAASAGGCALNTSGVLKCWGTENTDPDLYRGLYVVRGSNYKIPTALQITDTFAMFDGRYSTGCGITASQDLKCWGSNANGNVGDGRVSKTWLSPVDITAWVVD